MFHALSSILKARGLATSVGDEGGFAPNLSSDEETIETILAAIEKAGYQPGRDFMLAMDAASSEWKSPKGKGFYKLPKAGTEYTSSELIAHWKSLVEKYPIISIEDALDEEDWEGWQELTRELGGKVQLVGDDLFVTNTERLAKGIQLGAGNAILIKLNQIGSVSETLEAIKMAHTLTAPARPRTPPSKVANGSVLAEALCENQLDLALLENSVSVPDLHTEPIGTDCLCAVLAPAHPLAQQAAPDLAAAGRRPAAAAGTRQHRAGSAGTRLRGTGPCPAPRMGKREHCSIGAGRRPAAGRGDFAGAAGRGGCPHRPCVYPPHPGRRHDPPPCGGLA